METCCGSWEVEECGDTKFSIQIFVRGGEVSETNKYIATYRVKERDGKIELLLNSGLGGMALGRWKSY